MKNKLILFLIATMAFAVGWKTTDLFLVIGDPADTTSDREIIMNEGRIKWNDASGKLEFSNNAGGVYSDIAADAAAVNPFALLNYELVTSVGGSAMTVALKTAAGSDPSAGDRASFAFRDATITSGNFNVREVQAALSVTVDGGATLGHVDATDEPVHVYAGDNAGTVVLAVSSFGGHDTTKLHTTTAMSGASDDRHTLYSESGHASIPIAYIGKLISNQSTAGTYTATATEIAHASSAPADEHFCSGTVTDAGTAAITNGNRDKCVASVDDNATGDYDLNFAAGFFSAAPDCQISIKDNFTSGFDQATCSWTGTPTASEVNVKCGGDTGDGNSTGKDGDFTFLCRGPK